MSIRIGNDSVLFTRSSRRVYAILLALALTSVAQAATYYWDDGSVAINGASEGGTGAWTVGAAGWEDGASAQNWANGNDAVFGGTAGTLTLGGSITAGTVTFQVPGYSVDHGANTMAWGTLAGTGGFTKAGSASLTLSNASSASGTVTINAGTLEMGNDSALGTVSVVLNGGAIKRDAAGVTVANAIQVGTFGGTIIGRLTVDNYTTFSGQLTGSGALTVQGLVALSNTANTYNGAISLSNSSTYLYGAASEVIGDNASLNFGSSGAYFKILGGGTETVDGINGTSGNIFANGAGVTLRVGANNGTSSFGGTIYDGGGSFQLVKTGTGTLTLGGGNSYSGGTTVSNGVLQVGTGSGTAGVLPGNATIANGATLKFNYGATGVVYGGQLSGSGTVIVTGNNDLQLSGNNSAFTGTVIVDGSGGHLRMRNDNALNGTLSLILTNSGGVSAYSYVGNHNITAGSLSSQDSGTWIRLLTTYGLIVGGNNQSTTFAGLIKADVNAGGFVTKTGTGTLTLSNANTYSGNTTISQGSIVIQANNSLGTAGTVTLGDAGTGTNNVALLLDGTISGWSFARPIVVSSSGTGTATLGTTAGTAGSLLITSSVQLNRATTFQGLNTDRTTYSGVISGSVGTLTVTGGNRTTMENNNTFAGNVAITGSGTILQVGNPGGGQYNQIPDASNVDLGAGTYLRPAFGDNEAFNALTGAGTIEPITANAFTLTLGGSNGDGTFSGVIQNAYGGTIALTKAGNGLQALGGVNNYGGATTVSGGTLKITGSGQLGAGSYAGALAINSGNTLQYASSATQLFSSGITGSGTLQADGPGMLTLYASGSDKDYQANLTGAGPVTLQGAGNWAGLHGDMSAYSGTMTITGSAHFSNSGGNTGSALAKFAESSGATWLTSNEAGTMTVHLGELSGSGSIYGSGFAAGRNGTKTLSIGALGTTATYGGTIADGYSGGGSVVALTKTGTGALTLSGASAYSGPTLVNAGNLILSYGAGFNAGQNPNTTYTVSNATLTVAGGWSIKDSQPVTVIGGTLAFQNLSYLDNVTLSNATVTSTQADDGWRVAYPATPNLNFSGSNTVAQIRLIKGTGTQATFNVANGTTTLAMLYDDPSYTGTQVIKAGAGTLTFSGANVYSGGTTVNTGTLQVGTGSGTAGALPGNATIAGGATLKFNYGTTGVVYGGQLSGSGTMIVTGNNDLQLSGNNSGLTGTVFVDGAAAHLRMRNDNALNSTLSLVLTNGASVSTYSYVDSHTITAGSLSSLDPTTWLRLQPSYGLIVGGNNQSTTFAGVIRDDVSAGGFVTKVGTGTLTLTGTNTYRGVTTLSGGTVSVSYLAGGSTACNLGAAVGTSGYLVFNGGTLQYTGPTVSGINRAFTINAGGATIDVTGAATSLEWTDTFGAGAIIGTGALTKSGSGTLVLSGANSFSGNVTINAGTLQMGAFTALGPNNNAKTVSVASGATLDMHGYVANGGNGFFSTLNLGGTLLSTAGGGGYSFQTGWAQNYNVNLTGNATINIATSFGQLGAGYARTSLALNGNTLTKSGGGQYSLENADVGNGNINITGGSIYLRSDGGASRGTVIQGTGTITVGDGAGSGILYMDPYQTAGLITRPIVLNGGNLRAVSGIANVDSPITLAAGTTSYADLDNAGANLTLTGAIAGSGSLVIGNSVVSGSTLLTGDVSGFSGTLSYVDNAAGVNFRLQGSSTNFGNASLNLSGATTTTGRMMIWQGTSGATLLIGALSGTGGVIGGGTTFPGSAYTLQVGALGGSTTYAGVMQDNGSGITGSLSKVGAGTLTLTGVNGYSGATTVSGGTLKIAGSGLLGGGSYAGAITVTPGNMLQYAGSATQIFSSGITGAGTLQADGPGMLTLYATGSDKDYNASLTGAGPVTMQGAGNWAGLHGDMSAYSGTMTVTGSVHFSNSGGNTGSALARFTQGAGATWLTSNEAGTKTVHLGELSGSGNIYGSGFLGARNGTKTLSVGALGTSASFGGAIADGYSGGGSVVTLTKTGTGTLTLSGTSSYTGGTTISQGAIVIRSNSSLSTAGTVTLGDAGTGANNVALLLDGAITGWSFPRPIVVSSSGAGTATIGTTPGGAGSLMIASDIQLNRATTLQGLNTDRTTYSGVVSGSVGTLTVTGGNRTTMENSNTFAGNVAVTGSGTVLQLGNPGGGQYNQIPDSSTVDLESGTKLWLAFGDNEAINILTGSGTVEPITANAFTLTLGAGDGTGTYGGVIQNANGGTIALTKSGVGTLTLSGTNTYSGATTINGGTFVIGINGLLGAGSYAGAITDNAVLHYASSGSQTFSGAISGSGSLLKTGAGALTLSGPNSYGGGTTVSAGTALVTGAGTLGTGNVAVTGGTLDLAISTAINDAATLAIAPSGLVNAGSGVKETVHDLYLDDVRKWKGTWGAAGSGASYEDPHFTGTGYIIVTEGAPHPATVIQFK